MLLRTNVFFSEVISAFVGGGHGGELGGVGVVAIRFIVGTDVSLGTESICVVTSEVSVAETAAFVDIWVVLVEITELDGREGKGDHHGQGVPLA